MHYLEIELCNEVVGVTVQKKINLGKTRKSDRHDNKTRSRDISMKLNTCSGTLEVNDGNGDRDRSIMWRT